MVETLPFDEHVAEYEAWFDQYHDVFLSEVEAIRELIPEGENLYGLEVGVGTGRFSAALGIKEAVDPSEPMREIASAKGIIVRDAFAENLPYKDMNFDFVLMAFCISYFKDMGEAFKEAYRVLKHKGALIVGFIDKNSPIGKLYESRKPESVFYKHANFYSVDRVSRELKEAGFGALSFSQTLFHLPDEIKSVEMPQAGFGKGSFVLVKAIK